MYNNAALNDRQVSGWMFAGREDRMSDDNFQDQTPVYKFPGSSPADELLEIARIHHREAKQLLDSARMAEAEGRQEEAKLLMDLAISRRERAEEFEKAARGEGGDPIVTEILDSQQDLLDNYSSVFTPALISLEDLPPATVPKHMQPLPPGRIARAMAWISRQIQ